MTAFKSRSQGGSVKNRYNDLMAGNTWTESYDVRKKMEVERAEERSYRFCVFEKRYQKKRE